MQLELDRKRGAGPFGIVTRLLLVCAMASLGTACGESTDPEPRPKTYSSITTADYFSCDLESGGIAWCWGELGNNATTTVETKPVKVSTSLRFTSLTAYAHHVCGLTATGDAYCWGRNTDGQLGIGTDDAGTLVPTAVVGGVKFKALSAGSVHTCGISTAGTGYCWGGNTNAQGGHSTKPFVTSPTAVQGGHTWASISAGTDNTCGVTTAGAGYCWGSDTRGALGNGGAISGSSLDTTAMPVLVAGGHTWKQISVGQFHVCGVTTANAAYCWGFNDFRLGDGDETSTSKSAPVAVLGGYYFKSIDAGRLTTCALTTADQAYCWGANSSGQYGTSAPTDLSRIPVLAAGGQTFSELNTSSDQHTCGISVDRQTVKCFGRNDFGQLGNGATTASTVRNPTPTVVFGQEP